MTEKPQPLGLEFDKIMEEFFIKYKEFNKKNFQKFWKDYKKSEIIQDIKLIVSLCKHRFKSTCEFLIKEIEKGDWEVWSCGRSTDYCKEYWSEYSKKELIKIVKLVFKDVLEEKE